MFEMLNQFAIVLNHASHSCWLIICSFKYLNVQIMYKIIAKLRGGFSRQFEIKKCLIVLVPGYVESEV